MRVLTAVSRVGTSRPIARAPSTEEGILPIAIMAKDGRRGLRSFRSRWSRTEQGRVEVVQMFCPDCSALLIVQDLHLRVARTFACHLLCPGCSHGAIACGSRRTLFMALKLMIEEGGLTSHREPEANYPRPWTKAVGHSRLIVVDELFSLGFAFRRRRLVGEKGLR